MKSGFTRWSEPLSFRLRATACHLIASIGVAIALTVSIFWAWYPWPYARISGGTPLMGIILAVDVLLGPFLTMVVASPKKKRNSLIIDLSMVGALQAAGLAYGIDTLLIARPVALVFEVDRFRVISAGDVLDSELKHAPVQFRTLSFAGPILLGTRESRQNESEKTLSLALSGYDIAQRPTYWQSYELSRDRAMARALPLRELIRRQPSSRQMIDNQVRSLGLKIESLSFLPLQSRKTDQWVVLLTAEGQPAGLLPINGFL